MAVNNNIYEGQFRNWVRKYKYFGKKGLNDKREVRKEEIVLFEEEIKKNKEFKKK